MEWLLYLVIVLVSLTYLAPKAIVFVLCVVLRKFSFYASVGGPLTLNEIMLRIPLKMNMAILIRVEQAQISLSLPGLGFFESADKLISIRTQGLQVNLLLRDDFDKWNNNKIELLHVIDQFRMRLSRLGLLNDHNSSPSNKKEQAAGEAEHLPRQDMADDNYSETLKNVLQASTMVAESTKISFFVYKMDSLPENIRNIDEVNIQMFYQRCLLDKEFQRQYNCSRIFIATAQADFVRMNEDDFEVMVKSPQLLMLNSKYENEYGQLTDVELAVKVPRKMELVNDFCNWELNIKIQSGKFDISKGFIKRLLTFFTMIDTLACIFKEITTLVYKQHFQDIMFFKSGYQQRKGSERFYDNYRDIDIPKKVKLQIVDSVRIDINYPSKRLACFLPKRSPEQANLLQGHQERLRITLAPKTSFEMTFRINKTYYVFFESPRIDFEQNGIPCASIEKFTDQIDFVLKKEQTDFLIKQSPLELNQLIKAQGLHVICSPAFMKHILELMNFYKFAVSLASIKHKIFDKIQDPTFLLENIIERKNSKDMSQLKYTTEMYRELYEVTEIYEFETHLDEVNTQFCIQDVSIRHSSHDIYGEEGYSTSKFPNSYAADLSLTIEDFEYSIRKVGPTEETILKSAQLLLHQANRMSDSQRQQHNIDNLMPKDERPIAKALELSWQSFLKLRFAGQRDEYLPMSDQYNFKIFNKRFFAQALSSNFDFEFILDRTRDILDYSFVLKHFQRKWKLKYVDLQEVDTKPLTTSDLQQAPLFRQHKKVRPRNAIWRQVTESKSFYVPHLEIIFNMSRSRMLVMDVEALRPNGQTTYAYERVRLNMLSSEVNQNKHEFAEMSCKKHCESAFGDSQLEFLCTKLTIYHCKVDRDDVRKRKLLVNLGRLNSSDTFEDLLEPTPIMSASEFKLAILSKDDLTGVGIDTQKINLELPNDVFYGGLISEIDKQVAHVPAWIRETYKQYKQKLSFQFDKRYSASENLLLDAEDSSRENKKKPWRVEYNFKELQISLEDEPMLQLFTNQDDIVEMLSNRQIFNISSRQKINMLKSLKKSKIYSKFCELKANGVAGRVEIPERFLNSDYCLKWLLNHDEAHQYVKPDTFEHYDPQTIRFSANYMALHGRSMYKPVLEIWSYELKMEQMRCALNSKENPQLFQTDAVTRIFNRFPLNHVFNKLPTRFYYMSQMDMQKLKFNIQGQQTLLFFNDFPDSLDKISDIIDLSKSYDERMKKLPVLGGTWDQLRTMRRGSTQIKVKEIEIEVWPKRNFDRYCKDHLSITLCDFQYNKRIIHNKQNLKETILSHDVCLRRLMVTKEPLTQQSQSAILHLPLIEISLQTNYNKGKGLNHFKVLKAKNFDHYVQILQEYSTKQMTVQVKLNIPSFGTINPTTKSLYLPLLMQSYIAESPIPIIHVQRSNMKLFDSILYEYVDGGKVDISSQVKAHREKLLTSPSTTQRLCGCFTRQLKRPCCIKSGNQMAPAHRGNTKSLLESRHPKLEKVQNEEVISVFSLQVQAFLNDMMVLFTDYDDGGEECSNNQEEKKDQMMEPENNAINDELRDKYLNNYQGILFTTENLNFAATIKMHKSSEIFRLENENSFFKSRFLCLSAMNSSNLFQIRNKKLDYLRKLDQPNSMDNYNYFCRFFGIEAHSHKDFGLANRDFKTLFPTYVFNNENIRHAITVATGGDYEPMLDKMFSQPNYQPADEPKRISSMFGDSDFKSYREDLNFRECDTIAMIELVEYNQNQFIQFQQKREQEQSSKNSGMSCEQPVVIDSTKKTRNRRKTSSNIVLDTLRQNSLAQQFQETDQANSGSVLVRHLLDVKNLRFLYTKKVYELLHNHLVIGFDFTKYRRTDYINVEKENEKKRDFLDGYRHNNANFYDKQSIMTGINKASAKEMQSSQQKEAYMSVRLINPQINMQCEKSKAQALFTANGNANAMFFAYSEPEKAKASEVQIYKNAKGGKWNTNIIKRELCVLVDQMNIYVAPTYINLEKPTFWKPPQHKQTMRSNQRGQSPKSTDRRRSLDVYDPDANNEMDGQQNAFAREDSDERETNINALRKVLSFNHTNIKYVWLNASQSDHQNPMLDIDIKLSSVECEMDGSNLWQFIGVFKSTFLDRGEKSKDVLQCEEARKKDLQEFKLDLLEEKIKQAVSGALGNSNTTQRPYFSKRVSYILDSCEFKFFKCDDKFASGKVEQFRGMHCIYANKESKTDLDIEKITMLNHLEEAEDNPPMVVVSPDGDRAQRSKNGNLNVRETMLQIRARDQFKVVSSAPWRVFNHLEILLSPVHIQLTREFNKDIKKFFFDTVTSDPVDEPDELQEHYDLVIPQKALEKAMPDSSIRAREANKLAVMDTFSDNTKIQQKVLKHTEEQVSTKKGSKNQSKVVEKEQDFQSFFRTIRINEVPLFITYIHGKNSRLNCHNMHLQLDKFIKQEKFQTMQQMVQDYEKHCKKCFWSQTPNLLNQLIFKAKEKVQDLRGVDNDERNATIIEKQNRRTLLGEFEDN